MRKIALISFVLFLAEIATAQIPTSGNAFFGYSYFNTSLNGDRNSLNGWEASIEGKALPHIGIVGDFSGHYGSENVTACNGFDCVIFNADVTQHNYLFGPRVSASIGKFRPFAELLIGASHVNVHSLDSDTSFATGVGGGLDYRFLKLLAWRFQGDSSIPICSMLRRTICDCRLELLYGFDVETKTGFSWLAGPCLPWPQHKPTQNLGARQAVCLVSPVFVIL